MSSAREVQDRVDAARAKRGGERERVRTAEPEKGVVAGLAVEEIAAGIAEDDVAELVAAKGDRGQCPHG